MLSACSVGAQPPVSADSAAARPWRAPSFNFYDGRLLGGAWRREARPDIVREFFRVLAVCHTVIPDGAHALAPCRHSQPIQARFGWLARVRILPHARWVPHRHPRRCTCPMLLRGCHAPLLPSDWLRHEAAAHLGTYTAFLRPTSQPYSGLEGTERGAMSALSECRLPDVNQAPMSCPLLPHTGPEDPAYIKYQAESPDEAALVAAGKAFGFFFHRRTHTSVLVREPSAEQHAPEIEAEYEILNILEFDSTRKRMSVIARTAAGNIMLYCKARISIC